MFISPMLLHKSEAFDNNDWLTELKIDGIRMIYSACEGVQLFTRHANDVTSQFHEIISTQLPAGTILDGELIMSDKDGRPDFEELMSRFLTRNSKRNQSLARSHPVTFCAFDVISYQGKFVTDYPLFQRKELLSKIFDKQIDNMTMVPYIQGNGKDYFELVREQKLEGIVLKKANSKYEIGKRSESWLKSVVYSYETVLIKGLRKSQFGWMLSYADGRYAGLLELGVPQEAKSAVNQLSKSLKSSEDKGFIYFSKPLKCKVKYRNKTKQGLLRSPSFVEFDLAS